MACQAQVIQDARDEKLLSICINLDDILWAENDTARWFANFASSIFTEFHSMFDGTRWNYNLDVKIDKNDFWWDTRDLTPRIRALDCILRN